MFVSRKCLCVLFWTTHSLLLQAPVYCGCPVGTHQCVIVSRVTRYQSASPCWCAWCLVRLWSVQVPFLAHVVSKRSTRGWGHLRRRPRPDTDLCKTFFERHTPLPESGALLSSQTVRSNTQSVDLMSLKSHYIVVSSCESLHKFHGNVRTSRTLRWFPAKKEWISNVQFNSR